MININNWLINKFKFISTERWEPKQNERGQAECKQNKKSYWPKGVKLLKLKYT